MLPNSFINHYHSLISFFNNNMDWPGFALMDSAFSYSSGIFKGKSKYPSEEQRKQREERRKKSDKRCMKGYGLGYEETGALYRFAMKCAFAEETKGVIDEARLCLKSVLGECDWGAAESYPELVQNLKVTWRKRVNGGENKLAVNILFAWEDRMIGERGREYFSHCWAQEKCGSGIQVHISMARGTDHDSVLDSTKRFFREFLEAVKEGELVEGLGRTNLETINACSRDDRRDSFAENLEI
jgi:hypothetical protein